MNDARLYFDLYTVRLSTLHEIVEVLQYTHIFSSRCLAHVLRIKLAAEAGATKHE